MMSVITKQIVLMRSGDFFQKKNDCSKSQPRMGKTLERSKSENMSQSIQEEDGTVL
jgi:hypothetical protein